MENDILVDLDALREIVGELIHNAQIHAFKPYYFLKCSYYKENRIFDISIGDIGLGIKGTLSKKHEFEYLLESNDSDAILKALEEYVTSKNEARGTGLTLVNDYFVDNPGNVLFLTSGDGYYLVDHNNTDGIRTSGNLMYNLRGVQLLMRFRCEE